MSDDKQGEGELGGSPAPLDCPFHGAALRAWLEVATETGNWPPDSEATRRRAYDIYEAELRKRP